MPINSVNAEVLCVGFFFLFVLILLLWGLISDRRERASGKYSPEQLRALVDQGNALGLPALVILILSCLCIGLKWAFPAFYVLSKNSIVVFIGQILATVLFVGVAVYIAISSIKHRVSILRGRGQREYPRDESAVWAGISLLIMLAVGFLVWWLATIGQK